MAEFVKMPTLGFDMEEGTMGGWMKQVGDAVAIGDVLAEIESDKVTQELTSRAEGVLLAQLAQEGDIIPVGSNLAIIGAEGEDISGMAGDSPAKSSSEQEKEQEDGREVRMSAQRVSAESSTGIEFPDGVKATPVARRIARDKGIDLTQVTGTGSHGRIRKRDVESFVPASKSQPTVSYKPTSVPSGPDTTEVPLTRLRKAIARRMTESKQTIPQFYVTTAIDMTEALQLRKQINAALPEGEKVSVNDIIVKAVGLALRAFPNLNASFGGDRLIMHNRVNVSSAVAVEGGLLTVTQKDTDVTPLREVAKQNRAMIGRARSGKVLAEDVSGSTFSVSNLGAYQVDHFIAIINPPEAGIVAVGSAEPTAVLVDGEFVVRSVMKATCSADHRVTDGAEAAQFMQHIKATLETPVKLLI